MAYLTSFPFRRAFNVSLAVLLSVLISYFFTFSKEYWIILTAFLASQTTRGTPIKQGLFVFLIVIAVVVVSSILLMNISQKEWIYLIAAIIFIASGYLAYVYRFQSNDTYYFLILFALVFLIAILTPIKTPDYMQNRVLDALIGALIAIICGRIFPPKLEKEFARGVLPMLHSLADYAPILTQSFLRSDKSAIAPIFKMQIKDDKQNPYPEWVYEIGFNPGLRSGFRFFLINLERITDIFFSMNYLASRHDSTAIPHDADADITRAMEKNRELINILIEYFANKKIKDTTSDFTSDISALEASMHHILPSSLELIDISQAYVTLAAFVSDVKDLRKILLQLVMSLPTQTS